VDHLIRAASVAREAAVRNLSAEQVLEERNARVITRRDFLKVSAAAAGALALRRTVPLFADGGPRIAVVGAGLAGLTCAYRLRQAGRLATVYEASERVGGRCWTLRGAFEDGQIAEHGGELIDTGHDQIRDLIRELDL